MGSNIRIEKTCEWCGNKFIAQTTVTRFCSKRCAEHSYKARLRNEKVQWAQSGEPKSLTEVKEKDYLTVAETATLLGMTRQGVYKLIHRGELTASKLSSRLTLIKRTSIEQMLDKTPYVKRECTERKDKTITEFYTRAEIREKFGVKDSWIYKVVAENNVPKTILRGKAFFSKAHIDRLFSVRKENPEITEWYSNMSVEDLIFAACRGGWPASLFGRTAKAKLLIAKNYLKSVCSEDISRIDGKQRIEKLTRRILTAYARNISTLAKTSSILQDVTESDIVECSRTTYDDYVSALEKLFVIQDIDAWCSAIRSKTAIRSTPKRGFCDPSIAVAALGLTPDSLKLQLKTFGFIFEQMCIRDLKAYTIDMDSHVSYYHDRYGLEADMVLHLPDGRYAIIECKLGSIEIDKGAEHLLRIRELIREKNKTEKQMPIREPDLMIILTGGQMAYTRNDGVKVIPLATLRP